MKTAQQLVAEAKMQIQELSLDEAQQGIDQADVLIDVREPEEFSAGHLPNAINIPRGLLEFQMESTPQLASRDKKIVLYCKTSGRAALAVNSLKSMGYHSVFSIAGGFDAWLSAGKAVVKPSLPKFD